MTKEEQEKRIERKRLEATEIFFQMTEEQKKIFLDGLRSRGEKYKPFVEYFEQIRKTAAE